MKLAYTYTEAGELLGVHKDTIRALVDSGDLLPFEVTNARTLRVSAAELDRFIAAREEAQRNKYQHLTLGNTARNSA